MVCLRQLIYWHCGNVHFFPFSLAGCKTGMGWMGWTGNGNLSKFNLLEINPSILYTSCAISSLASLVMLWILGLLKWLHIWLGNTAYWHSKQTTNLYSGKWTKWMHFWLILTKWLFFDYLLYTLPVYLFTRLLRDAFGILALSLDFSWLDIPPLYIPYTFILGTSISGVLVCAFCLPHQNFDGDIKYEITNEILGFWYNS